MLHLLKKVFFLSAFCVLFLPFIVNADGIYIPPIDYYIDSSGQKAVIVYEKGVETLIVSTQFKGDAKNFGWVIPTPSRPEVSKSSDELFTSLEDLTAPKYYGSELEVMAPAALDKTEKESAVSVLETKKVGVYEIKVLEASDSKALATWLEENKYMYPKEGSYILDEYIQKRWYFVAAKIDVSALESLSATEALKEGHAQPIKLTFQSDKIIYPMKISSIQASLAKKEKQESGNDKYNPYYYPSNYVSVLLYVFADGKKELPGFTIDYAGYVKPKTIEKLAYIDGESWWKPEHKFYLTRLSRSMTFSEMTEDLIFRAADDNKPVGSGEKNTVDKILNAFLAFLIALLIWVFSFIGLIFIIFSFIRRSTKSKTTYTVSVILQWISFICTAIGSLVYLLVIAERGFFGRMFDFKDDDMQIWGVFIFGFAAIVVMLTILLVQRARYLKIKDTLK
ncbi:MAG: DUF2330 domain-containing protein [Patescibacteria group bacterium]